MKKIRFFRHSLKKDEFIGSKGFQLIEDTKDSIPQVSKIFVSPYVRTIQTAAHMMAITGQKKVKIIQLESLGNSEVEEKIFTNKDFIEEFKIDPSKNIYELMEKHFSPKEIDCMELKSAQAIHDIWDIMDDEEIVIAIGHSPYIKMAINGLVKSGYDFEPNHENMNELDYIDIEL